MNNSVFGKTTENVRKHRYIKLVTADKRRNQLVPEPNYHITISNRNMVILCYTDADSFIMHIKTEDFFENIANDVEKRFDTSNYEVDRRLLTGKNKKGLGLMKDELGGTIMTEFAALRPETYSYLMEDDGKHITKKKAKGTKKCVIKRTFKFNGYKDCLLNNEIILKSQQRFKSETHNVYTEEVNKIALSRNDDKRLQTFGRVTSYRYGTNAGKVCKTELLSKVNIK